MRWWPWRKRRDGERDDEAAKARAEAEARLRSTRRMTPHVERLANGVARIPADELAERIARAFGGRRPT